MKNVFKNAWWFLRAHYFHILKIHLSVLLFKMMALFTGFGIILLLPLVPSRAHAFTTLRLTDKKVAGILVDWAFRKDRYPSALIAMVFYYLLPLITMAFGTAFLIRHRTNGVILDGLASGPLLAVLIGMALLVLGFFMVTLMAMVPYILGDPVLSNRRLGAFALSAAMMRRSLFWMMGFRILMLPAALPIWYLVSLHGLLAAAYHPERFLTPRTWLIVSGFWLAVILFALLPFFHAVHTVLYTRCRQAMGNLPEIISAYETYE